MALIKPAPPPLAVLAFRDGLAAFLAGPNFGSVGTLAHEVQLGSSPALPTYIDVVSQPQTPGHDWQEVFVLGLNDLQAHKDLSAATPAGWRCFAGTIPGPVVVGYVAPRPPSFWRLTAVTFGTRASDALTESQALDAVPQVQTSDYNLRFLRIPGLNLELFWFVSLSGGNDLIIPSPAGSAQLQSSLSKSRFFDSPVFLSIVYGLASQRLAYPATMGS